MEMNVELEHVACDLCGSPESVPIHQSHDYWHGTPGTFSVVRCTTCGLLYLNPRPTERSIGAFYPDDYYAYMGGAAAPSPTLRNRIKRVVRGSRALSAAAVWLPMLRDAARDAPIRDDVAEWIPQGRVLDVGCGSGRILDTMSDMGWEVFGVEPDAAAASRARTRGHRVFCQSVTEPLPEKIEFDVILVSHTLEHVHSPRRALTLLHSVLRPGTGRMVIEVPNADSLFTQLFQGLATAFDTPRHLYLYTPATLERFLVDTGFTIHGVRHRSGPQQVVKSLTLVSKLFAVDGPHADGILQDTDVLAAFRPLAELATARRKGGAIRITVGR
jgi:2-polyprenyl-3-methyl-5-hydroxy-6-metoxy-1,4-benzoquinol methylase